MGFSQETDHDNNLTLVISMNQEVEGFIQHIETPRMMFTCGKKRSKHYNNSSQIAALKDLSYFTIQGRDMIL